MSQKSVPEKEPATQVVKNIRRATRRHFSAEDKIRIVLEGRAAMTVSPSSAAARVHYSYAPQSYYGGYGYPSYSSYYAPRPYLGFSVGWRRW